MRLLLLAVLVAMTALSCGSDATPSPTFDRIPTAVVFDWLNAVATSDTASIGETVESDGLAIVAAAESAFTLEETAGLLTGGMSESMTSDYWAMFREEFAGFAGAPMMDLEVGVYEEFTAGGTPYAVVTIHGDGGTGTVVASRDDDGWKVDMVATVGPALVAQIRRMAEGLDDTASSLVVMEALSSRVLPGLKAAVQLDPSNNELAFEVTLLERVLPAPESDA